MKYWHLPWLALLAPLPSACSPPHMYQRASTRIENGQACFSVNDTKETRRTTPSITGAYVEAREAGVRREAWRWDMPYPTSIPLRPDQCIAYGFQGPPGSLDVYEPLRTGVSYSVTIRGEVPNPYPGGDPTIARRFSQQFCVREGPQGREIVLMPTVKGREQWQVCDSHDAPAIPGTLNSD